MGVDDRDNLSDERPAPATPPGKRRRYLTRRNAVIAGLSIAILAIGVVVLSLLAYRLGFTDRYLANQIKSDLAKYGIRLEIKTFHASVPPQNVEFQGLELFDAQSGEKLGKVDRLRATIRIQDLYALNLQRHVDLKDLQIEGLEVWVNFDNQGRSNFRNIHIPPPEANKRILFSYSTAHVDLKNSVVHYGDAQHAISGEGRNLKATIEPDDPNAPATSAMNKVALALSESTFMYDGRPVNNIGIDLNARVNDTRAEVQDLTLRSPVAETHLQGTLDDWRAFRYQMNVTSTVDLTQLSDVLQSGTALRGAGNFVGTVSGEGDRYNVKGIIKSDALAADGVRLQGLNVTGSGTGQGKSYEVNGQAVADLLNAGDFQLNSVQLVGKVMGTGSDFRWIGDLRAAAERSYGTTITGLILHDVHAEMNDGVLTTSSPSFTAQGLITPGAKVNGLGASELRMRVDHGVTTGSIAKVKAGEVSAPDVHVKGVTANNIEVDGRNGVTSVNIKEFLVGGITAPGAEIGSLNVAGVRLSIRAGRVEGSSGDVNVGTVKLTDGQLDEVKLARPVFVVEPSGRYRASADLSIGGGVLGQMNMGRAKADLAATNSEIQFNNFTADFFDGHADGNVTISLSKAVASHVALNFAGLDIASPLAVFAGTAVPLAGKAAGKIDVSFPDTDFKRASGSINTQFTADTVADQSDRTPISGALALRANNGLFQIERVDLQTAASHLKATGQFSFAGDSDLQVDLNSTDASELQRIAMSWSSVEDRMNEYGVEFAGQMAFNGNIRGKLTSPDVDGRFSLGSLRLNGTDVGSLAASVVATEKELRVPDGKLSEQDGGGIQFSVNAPRSGENNVSVEATLDRANARTLLAALPKSQATPGKLEDTQSDVSGRIAVTGIPGAMHGSADLRFGPGRIGGEPLESMTARATFDGANVKLETVDARFTAGHITASGSFDIKEKTGDINLTGQAIQLGRLAALASRPGFPTVAGTADLTAHVFGNFVAQDFSSYQITFDAQGKDVTVNGRPIGELQLVGRTDNKQLNVTFTTGVFGAAQQVTAQVNLADEHLPATIDATLNGADLTRLLAIALPNAGVKLSGRAGAVIKASGNLVDEDGELSLAGLKGTAAFSELSFRVEDIQLAAAKPFTVRLTANEVVFDQTQFTGTQTNLNLNGAVAIREGGQQSFSVDGRMNLRIVNGLSRDVFSSGIADVAVRVSGSYEQPRVSGTAALTGASIAVLVANDRWQLSNIRSLIRFTADQAQIESFTALLGGGRVNASGGALLDGLALSRFSLAVHADNVTAPFPQDFSSTLDADVEIRGDRLEQVISGTVNLRRTEYTKDIELADLINRRREESIEEGGEISFVNTAQFTNLRVEGRNALVVRNNLADVVGSVSLEINGPVKDPVISGRITATRGTLNFRNDRYDIVRAFVDLPPRRGADPLMNIEAESQIRGYRVLVGLTGALSQPQANVRSEPALPQADVVSLITTGTLAATDTGTSVLAQSGLGTATSLLTDALINAPAQKATSKLFGLSRFEINPVIGGPSTNPGARLTLGKRISKELSVTYSTNVTSDPNQILSVEYRVSDRLSFVAQYEQASTRQLSSRNNSFNFDIRFRKRF